MKKIKFRKKATKKKVFVIEVKKQEECTWILKFILKQKKTNYLKVHLIFIKLNLIKKQNCFVVSDIEKVQILKQSMQII